MFFNGCYQTSILLNIRNSSERKKNEENKYFFCRGRNCRNRFDEEASPQEEKPEYFPTLRQCTKSLKRTKLETRIIPREDEVGIITGLKNIGEPPFAERLNA